MSDLTKVAVIGTWRGILMDSINEIIPSSTFGVIDKKNISLVIHWLYEIKLLYKKGLKEFDYLKIFFDLLHQKYL